jgi:Flp pilus assembly protein CpaB
LKKISNKLIIAIALILITGIIFYFQNIKEYEAEVPMASVIVAVKDIPEDTLITKDMVQIEKRYSEDILKQQDYLTSTVEKVVGKRTVTPIYKNEEINQNRLIENQPYMEEKDNEKRTMFTIAITTTMDKALNIKEGSFIDIWLQPNQNIYSE